MKGDFIIHLARALFSGFPHKIASTEAKNAYINQRSAMTKLLNKCLTANHGTSKRNVHEIMYMFSGPSRMLLM